MSGIIGAWNSKKALPWQQMFDDLDVCGRDGKGDWHDANVELSLGRTQAFNTPESCLEPPVVESDGCVLVWDGRIDDRETLIGDRVKVTDAQIIIDSYRRWGMDCLKHLVGEFVFILWDVHQEILFVGCDVVGGRTIAYSWNGETLLLASRVVTLLLHPQVSSEFDWVYLAHTLCYLWAHPPELTPFAQIKRLQSGHALILQNGSLQHRQIHSLTRPQSYQINKTEAYDEFWHLLDCSVKDRLRTHNPICTTLSGGLDSTTVTVALLNQLSKVNAFSNVTTVFAEFDEREPIQSFLQQYPQVEWQGVNCDLAWAFSGADADLPLADDPLVPGTMTMNLQLYRQVKESGFGVIFDGEWGDSLFGASFQDCVRSRNWQLAIKHLQHQKNWRSTLWRYLAMPSLPPSLQRKFYSRWQNRENPFASWLKPVLRESSAMKVALEQYYAGLAQDNLLSSMNWAKSCSGSVGATQAYRLYRHALGVESASPFQDYRLLKFALNLSPSIQQDFSYNKIFLRHAAQEKLPDDIRWRPKNNYFDPLRYAGMAKGDGVWEILKFIQDNSFLSTIINSQLLDKELKQYRLEYQNNYHSRHYFKQKSTNFLYAVLCMASWYKKLHKRYL
ncbi:MAG: asparagine synthase-related protein [Cyanobacteria bacterium J06600_6]